MSSQKLLRFTVIAVLISCLAAVIPCSAQDRRGIRGDAVSRPVPGAVQSEQGGAAAEIQDNLLDRIRNVRRQKSDGMRLGMLTADSSGQGAQVLKITPYSIAEKAGFSTGDIIVEFDGIAVTNDQQFMQIVAGLVENTSHVISFVRDGSRLKTTVLLAENTTFFSAAAAPRSGLMDINTLRYALFDPKTRNVTFVGSYDPAFATGPIPYVEILRDALANPYPSLSLEPNAQQRADLDKVNKMISADMARMYSDPDYGMQWAQKLTNLLLYDTSLTIDNKRFFRNSATAFNMSGEELKRLYDVATGKITAPLSESFGTVAKLMRGIGLPDVGDALLIVAGGGDPDDLIYKLCEAMGLKPQYMELANQLKAGRISYDQFHNEGIILAMSAICRRFEAPEAELQSRISASRSGPKPNNIIIDYFGEQMGSFITDKAGARMINGLVLSPELMSKMYNLPVPRSDLVFTNVPADSHLGEALFRADYLLKTLCSNPDIRDKFASHLTFQEFLQKESVSRNFYLPVDSEFGTGNRLVPAEVKMLVSPQGDVIKFEKAQVKVISWVRELHGKTKTGPAADFVNSVVSGYGDFLSRNYDEYARIFPEWHRMAEVAKCVALARWAKANNYTINIAGASGEKVPLPREIPGFWTAVFHVEGDKAFMTFNESGGASFSEDEGEAWLKTQQDDTVASDLSRQLVASTMLAEKAASAAIDGDLEAARELADKSARAMSGDIDLNMLPTLSEIPMPGEPAIYAAADAELINQASAQLDTMKNAQHDLRKAQDLQASSPREAESLRQQASLAQDNARTKLQELLAMASTMKNNPSSANAVVISLKSGSPMVMPFGNVPTGGQVAVTNTVSKPQPAVKEEWPVRLASLQAELDEIDRRLATTRTALLRLSATIQADRQQYAVWEKAAGDAFDRCVNMAADVAVDFGAGAIADRYKEINELAEKLPGKPADLIEKYRYLSSLAQRMVEAKATGDFANLAARENKTEAELYESLRDGIGQIIGLLKLDQALPPLKFWKYGSLAADMAYNLTELRLGWQDVTALQGNSEMQLKAVKKQAELQRLLMEKKKELLAKIEAGEPIE